MGSYLENLDKYDQESLREKCPYSKFFWSLLSCSISSYSV